MQYVGDQITNCRRDTRNEDVPSTGVTEVGIVTADPLRYMNYAQDRLVSIILNTNPQSFQAEKIISIVANQEEYTIPDRVMAGERIVSVQYSPDGNLRNYVALKERAINYRVTEVSSFVGWYIRRNGRILINPIPSGSVGTIRVVYEREPDDLDLRRGQITAATVTSGAVTSITLDTGSDDDTALAANKYLCVSTSDGNVTAYNIPFTGYDTTTGIVTISGGTFTLGTGETVDVGSYVTVGKYTTTHSKLADICERYLELYTDLKLFRRDSSADDQGASQELSAVEKEITDTYEQASKDEENIQISDPSLLINPWYW